MSRDGLVSSRGELGADWVGAGSVRPGRHGKGVREHLGWYGMAPAGGWPDAEIHEATDLDDSETYRLAHRFPSCSGGKVTLEVPT